MGDLQNGRKIKPGTIFHWRTMWWRQMSQFLLRDGVCWEAISYTGEGEKWGIRAGEHEEATCCVCGCKGASTSCQGRKCTKTFHFPCGAERGCIYHFFGEFKSFCWKHRPVQRVGRRRQQGETICVICLESMVGKPSYGALVCPACKHSWFHRACIQGHALRAALYHFRCPRCRDMETFQREMFRMGIKIPDRDAAWEEDGAFSDQYHRHSRCDASCCLHAGGREQSTEDGPWKLLLCNSCGSYGTHRRCSALGNTTSTWECENCAGPASEKSR
uniref:G2/M phase-specific E3 ubiquitin-protein ligase n=1 Tax=Pelusios castaneus TaxID=367368 RepID=A0A8C8VLF4_9SAUR